MGYLEGKEGRVTGNITGGQNKVITTGSYNKVIIGGHVTF